MIDTTPEDLDEEELAAYATEMVGISDAEFADLADADLEEVFSLSDLDEDMNMS
jgi:hypothetical protein